MRPFLLAATLTFAAAAAHAQRPANTAVSRYVKVPAATTIVLQHVRIIDGTGAPALEDQTLTLRDGKIASLEASVRAKLPVAGATVLDLTGRTAFPGGNHPSLRLRST